MKNKGFNQKSDSLQPTILTIFGATGDLSADYLIPAFLHLIKHKALPKSFKLVCVGRRDFTAKTYFDFIEKKSSQIKNISKFVKSEFLKQLVYFKGDFDAPEGFKNLNALLSDVDKNNKHKCSNRLYYFATKPQQFVEITKILKQSGLLVACGEHKRSIRVLVEKPFGYDLKSAIELNKLLLLHFKEEEIYRIDHYVGKETVQNLMVIRFANSLFEPLWNNRFIDHIEISVLEKDGVGGRVNFYEKAGALRDFLQNHILQMLALIAMDEPYNLTAEHIHEEKVKVLSALEPLSSDKIQNRLVRGQYEGYEKEVKKLNGEKNFKTSTETFFALKTYVNLPRWQGVPFYLRTGKKLSKKLTQISIHFREPVRCLFQGCSANILTFQIQPDESVFLQINNKIPGFGIKLHQGNLDFNYKMAFKGEIPGAYERLLLDFLEGDQRLFIRSDEIESAWKFVDSIIQNPQFKKLPLHLYKQGSNGPLKADNFIQKDMKEWWTR